MSHFTEIKTNFLQKHEKQLIAALEEHFGSGKVEVHTSGEELRTYAGTLASKAQLGHTEKCHLIIRRKTQEDYIGHSVATNDAGFARNGDGGYDVFVDRAGFSTELQGLVAQSYTLLVAENELQAEGYQTSRVSKEDGSVRLEARIYA